MKRDQALDILMLLGALESWAMSQKERLPDYLVDRISESIEVLRDKVLAPDQENAA